MAIIEEFFTFPHSAVREWPSFLCHKEGGRGVFEDERAGSSLLKASEDEKNSPPARISLAEHHVTGRLSKTAEEAVDKQRPVVMPM